MLRSWGLEKLTCACLFSQIKHSKSCYYLYQQYACQEKIILSMRLLKTKNDKVIHIKTKSTSGLKQGVYKKDFL